MVVITVEAYQNARVHTITVKIKIFWRVKMKDVQDGFDVKSISDLLGKAIRGILATNNPKKNKK